MRTDTATERERHRVQRNAYKIVHQSRIEKKSKAADKKKKPKQTRQRKIRNALFYLFITMKVLRANATNINTHGAEKKKHVLSLLLIE